MIRKFAFGTGALVALGTVLFSWDAYSYMRAGANTATAKIRRAVKREIPLEVEFERVRAEVEALVPDIRDMLHVVATDQVNVEHKSAEVIQQEAKLETQKNSILKLREDLGSGDAEFVYAGQTFTCGELRKDLEKRFKLFKVAGTGLKSERQILRAWQSSLKANQSQLDTLLTAKQDLEVQIEQLESRQRMIEATEATANLSFDTSRLARAKKMIADLGQALDVRERQASLEGIASGLIPIEESGESTADSIDKRIDAYFGTTATSAVTASP